MLWSQRGFHKGTEGCTIAYDIVDTAIIRKQKDPVYKKKEVVIWEREKLEQIKMYLRFRAGNRF